MILALILYLLGAYLVWISPEMDDYTRTWGAIGWPFFALYLVIDDLLGES